jgi:hypothetical protein
MRVGETRLERRALTIQRNMYFITGAKFSPCMRISALERNDCTGDRISYIIPRYCHDLSDYRRGLDW